jgi:hypothetical protein
VQSWSWSTAVCRSVGAEKRASEQTVGLLARRIEPNMSEVFLMKISRIAGATAILSMLVASTAFAQTPSPPESTSTPSSASSPSQRDATRSPAKESSTAEPSNSSTAHQREAMGSKHQTMKQCMDAQGMSHPGKSKSDMTKSCEDQMKKHKTSESTTPAAPK